MQHFHTKATLTICSARAQLPRVRTRDGNVKQDRWVSPFHICVPLICLRLILLLREYPLRFAERIGDLEDCVRPTSCMQLLVGGIRSILLPMELAVGRAAHGREPGAQRHSLACRVPGPLDALCRRL